MRQIILDTETTGLSPQQGHRIIEIGCIELINRQVTNNNFHAYINPAREVEKEAFAVHGLSDKFLSDKPLFEAIAPAFLEFIQGAELIIHNAPFDVGFLDYEFAKIKLKKITHYCTVFDTLALARKMHMGQRNSLDALCKRYFVDNSHRELHGALLDATLLADVYLAMTGGQINLFDTSAERLEAKKVVSVLNKTQKKTRVIAASENELSAHQQVLAVLAKKGKCVWVE